MLISLHLIIPVIGFLTCMVSSQQPSAPNIPTEVFRRYGGLSTRQKRDLFTKYQTLQFVSIPDFLKSQITTVDSLERFGVCKTPEAVGPTQAPYFVCPNLPSSPTMTMEDEKRFCCGPVVKQYCCSAAEFISGIRIISPAQRVSPAVIIGCSLAFLLSAAFLAIVAYARIARGLRKQSMRMQNQFVSSVGHGSHREGGSKISYSSSQLPPKKQLLSVKNKQNNGNESNKICDSQQEVIIQKVVEYNSSKATPAPRLISGVSLGTNQTRTASAKKQAYKRHPKN